jgi:MoaA/NifB/PqqE/SkfB family radical SAM enzyme
LLDRSPTKSSNCIERETLMASLVEPNEALAWQEFRDGVRVVSARPTWITLETTAVCNLRCVQCAREYPGGTFEETQMDEALFGKLEPFIPYLKHLQLHGLGEPLLAPLFWQIVENEETRNIDIVDTNSNGTLFTPRNVDRLLNSALKLVNISLDAATQPTFKKIRGGNLDKIIAGIRRLTTRRAEMRNERPDAEFLRIVMNMTLMVENIRELPTFIELASDLGVDEVEVWHLNLRGDGTANDWRITHDGWEFVYDEQHLSHAPALSNEMVRQATELAKARGIAFNPSANGASIWFPE